MDQVNWYCWVLSLQDYCKGQDFLFQCILDCRPSFCLQVQTCSGDLTNLFMNKITTSVILHQKTPKPKNPPREYPTPHTSYWVFSMVQKIKQKNCQKVIQRVSNGRISNKTLDRKGKKKIFIQILRHVHFNSI